MDERKHILVVDREPEWRGFAARVLLEAGYVVSMHHDVATSLSEISQRASDLVLADASLDNLLNGLAKDHPDVRFVVFTASPSVVEALAAYRRGALDYESKSFDPLLILAAVKNALQKRPVRMPRFVT